jgi:hypothetical protein
VLWLAALTILILSGESVANVPLTGFGRSVVELADMLAGF